MMERPIILGEKCNTCGLCVDICDRGGLTVVEGKIGFVEEVECDYCGECEAVCPTGAIDLYYDIVLDREY